MGHSNFRPLPLLARLAIGALTLLTLAPAAALAAEEETHVFNATLSLTGNCSTSTADPVADPGLCPMPPGVAGVDHPSAAFASPKGIAVDPYGDRYVSSFGPEFAKPNQGRIDVFAPDGTFVTEIADHSGPQAIAVDGKGNLYVIEYSDEAEGVNPETRLVRFKPTVYKPEAGDIEYGAPPIVVDQPKLGGFPPVGPGVAIYHNTSLAIDPLTEGLLVGGGAHFYEFSSAADDNAVFAERGDAGEVGERGSGTSFAVDGAQMKIYAEAHPAGTEENLILIYDLETFKLLGTIDGSTTPAGKFLSQQSEMAVAVEESTGHVFVGDFGAAKKVYELEADGGYVSTIAHSFQFLGFRQIVVDNSPKSPTYRYLFVESGEAVPGHSYAFEPKARAKHKLTVSVSGNGKVSANTGTISGCTSAGGPSCEGEYEEGAIVTLTETPAEGNEFKGWGTPQCDESVQSTCEVTIGSGEEALAASFEEEAQAPGFELTVALEGPGTVSADSGLISCNPFCSEEYPEGTKVTLSATPTTGSLFLAWKGCDAGAVNGRQCTVTMSKAKKVSAIFTTAHLLTVAKADGSGPGRVQASGGLSCPYACEWSSLLLREGTAVTVKETPARHFHFAGWSGACSGTGACEVSMGEEHSVQADFQEDPKLALTLAKSGGGQALVKTKPAALLCGYACPGAGASFYEGEAIEVHWTLGKGTSSIDWGAGAGTCTGTSSATEGACTLTMSAATELTAELE